MAIEEKIVSFEKLSRYDQQIKAYIDHELSQIETGTDTSDATATEDKVFLDETFYAGGQKRTGTFTIESELNSQDELIASIRSALAGKTAGSGYSIDDIVTGGASVTGDVYTDAAKITAYVFNGNTQITSLSAPNVTSIGDYALNNATALKSVYLPSCVSVGQYVFNKTTMTSVSLPECASIGNYGFGSASKLATLELPKCKTIGNSALTYIAAKKLILPECTSIGNSSLTSCPNLEYVDLHKCTSIVNYGLRNNSKLATLIVRSETVCSLSNYALNSTKVYNGTGHIYVPAALIDSYRTATNWTKINANNADTFRALEDYTIDGTIMGELDTDKI